jgi:hypothetical protein
MKCVESAGVAGLHDDLAGLDLDALAAADQLVGVVLAVEYEIVGVPGQHERRWRWWLKGPAQAACFLRRYAGEPERHVRRQHASDQDDRQPERAAEAMQGQIQRQRHRAGRAELRQRGSAREVQQRPELRRMIGDHPDRTHDEQKSGGA